MLATNFDLRYIVAPAMVTFLLIRFKRMNMIYQIKPKLLSPPARTTSSLGRRS